MRNTMKKWLSASTLVALVFAVSNRVEAGYGSSGGSSGYVAGYGSSGGYYGGGSTGGGSSGGHVGPIRRLGARIHDHFQAKVAQRANFGSSGGSSGGVYRANYGSSGGSHGGYVTGHAGSSGGGSSGAAYYGSTYSVGGSTGSYAPALSGGSTGSYGGGSTGSVMQYGNYEGYASEVPMMDGRSSSGTVVVPNYSSGAPGASSVTQTANKLASSQSIGPNEVHLTVNLPESAKIFVNGNPTNTTGSKRHFVSRDLKPKDSYRFEVKAVLTKEDGTEVVQNKTVVVDSGNGEELSFEMLKADDPIETVLTLNVPEKARVVLAQNHTKSEGTSRVFRTKQLQDGQSWDDYKIEVTYEGVTKAKTIRLLAGDKLEMTFDFETAEGADKVAMN